MPYTKGRRGNLGRGWEDGGDKWICFRDLRWVLAGVGEGQLADGVATSAIKEKKVIFSGVETPGVRKSDRAVLKIPLTKKSISPPVSRRKTLDSNRTKLGAIQKQRDTYWDNSFPFLSRLLATTNVRVHANTLDIVQPNIGSVENRRRAEQGQTKKF